MNCFVDTSAFLAVLDRSDRLHEQAGRIWEVLLGDRPVPLVTTNYVLVETLALIQRRLGLEAVRSFSAELLPVLRIVWIDRELHQRSMAVLLSQSRRHLSLVDCSSFEVMRSLGIGTFFAFDRDFENQGFQPFEPPG